MKTCSKCQKDKDISEFYRCRDGYQYWCKSCTRQRMTSEEYKKWYSGYAKTSRNKEIQDAWRRSPAGVAAVRKYAMKRKFGIEPIDYEFLLRRQDGVCSICKKTSEKNLHIDHCHTTKKIRGLLCGNCNRMLGMARDNIQILNSAIDYLDRHRIK